MKKFFKIFLNAIYWIITVLIVLFTLLLSCLTVYVQDKLSKIQYVDIKKEDLAIAPEVERELNEYRCIALFGIDTRKLDTYEDGRSDCIMIVRINEKTKDVKMVSVYRDTYLEIANKGMLDKVTHAYAYGGPSLSLATLNSNLDLNIEEFVTVNFTAAKDIIDSVGGIEMTVTDKEAKTNYIPGITKGGTYLLNGAQALGYSRIRKIDSDYVRTERMRNVIIAVFNKVKKMNPVEINKIVDKLLPEVYTNIDPKEILAIVPEIPQYNVSTSIGWPFKTKGIILNGVWYGPPINLEQNVIDLHKELFGTENYVPTTKVHEISEKIIRKTGYR